MFFYHCDDFVSLGEGEDLDGFARELNETLIVKICGTIGPEDSDIKGNRLLNRIARYGNLDGVGQLVGIACWRAANHKGAHSPVHSYVRPLGASSAPMFLATRPS